LFGQGTQVRVNARQSLPILGFWTIGAEGLFYWT